MEGWTYYLEEDPTVSNVRLDYEKKYDRMVDEVMKLFMVGVMSYSIPLSRTIGKINVSKVMMNPLFHKKLIEFYNPQGVYVNKPYIVDGMVILELSKFKNNN